MEGGEHVPSLSAVVIFFYVYIVKEIRVIGGGMIE